MLSWDEGRGFWGGGEGCEKTGKGRDGGKCGSFGKGIWDVLKRRKIFINVKKAFVQTRVLEKRCQNIKLFYRFRSLASPKTQTFKQSIFFRNNFLGKCVLKKPKKQLKIL